MSTFRRARVTAVSSWGGSLQRAQVEFADGSRGSAVVLEEMTGAVDEGDEVIANTTAVDLGLGSGGFHFVVWNLSCDSFEHSSGGHIMKLRYTPLQFDVLAVEEQGSPHHDALVEVGDGLESIPVIAGSLHSQLLPAAVAFRHERPEGRLVYVMTDGGCLPLGFSDTVRFLEREGYIDSTVTYGHAFGGELEAVNIFGALLAARKVEGADAVVCLMGPGIAGTGTEVGFSGMEQGIILNAAMSLNGAPIAIPRITFGDPRDRHRGLSHHTVSVLRYAACVRSTIAVPVLPGEKRELVASQLEDGGVYRLHDVVEVDAGVVPDLIRECGYTPTVMGRGPGEEPEFFMAAGAAGLLAARGGEAG